MIQKVIAYIDSYRIDSIIILNILTVWFFSQLYQCRDFINFAK